MAKDHEVDFQVPIASTFGSMTKTAISALLFKPDAIYSVDAATNQVVKLLDYASLTTPQKTFIKNLATAHRDAVAASLTTP